MTAKTTDLDTFIQHIESLLYHHEGSDNTNGVPVVDRPVDARQAAVLKKLDTLLLERGCERTLAQANNNNGKIEENQLRKDLSPGVRPTPFFCRSDLLPGS